MCKENVSVYVVKGTNVFCMSEEFLISSFWRDVPMFVSVERIFHWEFAQIYYSVRIVGWIELKEVACRVVVHLLWSSWCFVPSSWCSFPCCPVWPSAMLELQPGLRLQVMLGDRDTQQLMIMKLLDSETFDSLVCLWIVILIRNLMKEYRNEGIWDMMVLDWN